VSVRIFIGKRNEVTDNDQLCVDFLLPGPNGIFVTLVEELANPGPM